jgi:signal transduction histidine kinase
MVPESAKAAHHPPPPFTPAPTESGGPEPTIGAFLGALAHEFGNTSYTLQLLASALENTDTQAPTLRDLPDTLKGMDVSVSRLMNALRRISRIARGTLPVKPSALDAVEVVGRAVEAIRPLMEERRHRLETYLSDSPIPLWADPDLLQEAVVQLLDNAARYTPPGGRVGVTVREEDGHLDLRIRDTGPGIDPGLLPHVFDLFRRGGGQAPDFTNGHLGVGLALVKQVAEKHHGTVQILSGTAGEGTEVLVRLPLAPRP